MILQMADMPGSQRHGSRAARRRPWKNSGAGLRLQNCARW
jgi:hypothetical protein